MSIDVWPAVSPAELMQRVSDTQELELAWVVRETIEMCRDLKHGLEDCYALLAPIDPGSTLVMSTPRNEKVKGTITRVGTRIVKASLHIQLRTIPAQTLSLSPSDPIHIHALDSLHTHLTQCVDLLSLLTSRPQDARSLASALTILSESLADSADLLKGAPTNQPDPTWQHASCSPKHFSPALPQHLSFHVTLQDSCIVLFLRGLEPAGAPVNFGTKLGLAIGTVRRLEHDEMDKVFTYCPKLNDGTASRRGSARHTPEPASLSPGGEVSPAQEVYVREKVRVESADPNLISLYSKLGYLSHQLGQARYNLAAVMGVDLDE
ncbi:RAVE subunit 2/Rogdi [Stachybotrys elegans]|uniref:RAVE subunit 2/Rogdi n=1 Tax=Stachybotrys elegans TaxID=80388 RepID=A0A8K0WQB6_9HYPO|nr:RAVE subunit 2/Rogdi [Stachybotrys elegans]